MHNDDIFSDSATQCWDPHKEHGSFFSQPDAAPEANNTPHNKNSRNKARDSISQKEYELLQSVKETFRFGNPFHGGYAVLRDTDDGKCFSFVVTDLSPADRTKIYNVAKQQNNIRHSRCLRPALTFIETAGNTTVFNYTFPTPGLRSLRSWICESGTCFKIEEFFRKLLDLLRENHSAQSFNSPDNFVPMYFLSVDSIMMDESYELYFVPIPPVKNATTYTMAPELLTGIPEKDGTMESDVYTIASIAVSMGHGGWLSPSQRSLPDEIIRAMCANPNFRPSLMDLFGDHPYVRPPKPSPTKNEKLWNTLFKKDSAREGTANRKKSLFKSVASGIGGLVHEVVEIESEDEDQTRGTTQFTNGNSSIPY